MERRFEERKREIEQDAHIDKQALAGCVRQLQLFGKPYFAHFLRSETRQNAQVFLEGLLSDLPRKNLESIAYRYEQERSGLQRFTGQTDWDHQPLLTRLAEQVAVTMSFYFKCTNEMAGTLKTTEVIWTWKCYFGTDPNTAAQ